MSYTIYKTKSKNDTIKYKAKKGNTLKENKVNGLKIIASNGPVGFEESINISPDFKAEEIKFKQFSTSFSISGETQRLVGGDKSNNAVHRFRYTRIFFQDISNSQIKVSQNTATVVGRFSYGNKTSEDL